MSAVPGAQFTVGMTVSLRGYFTQFKSVAGRDAKALARTLGFADRLLVNGWALLQMTRVPKADEFEMRGYTHLPGGGKGLDTSKLDVAKLKELVIKEAFSTSGPNRLVKVIPNVPGKSDDDYPKALGAPQWEAVKPLPYKVVGLMPAQGKQWQH